MKKIVFISCLILLCFSACQEENTIDLKNQSGNITTNSLNPSGFSTNWENWTEIQITTSTTPVDLPWKPDCPTSIPWETRMDIKKNDGWKFLSTNSTQTGTDYLIFYNRFTGMLKIFYYNSVAVLNNNVVWEFFDETLCGFFNQGIIYSTPMSSVATRSVGVNGISNNSTLGVDLGWNCVQIPLTLTNLPTGNNALGRINVYSKVLNISSLTLTGNYTEITTGTIIEDHFTESTQSTLVKSKNSVVKTSGSAAEEWVKKQAEKALSNTPSMFKNFAVNILSSVAQNGVSGFVDAGLTALFGSFIGSTKTNTPTTQTVELRTNGELQINGTMTANQTGTILPLTGIVNPCGFGAWNIKNKPKVRTSVQHRRVELKLNNPYGKKNVQEYYWFIYSPTYQVVINPDIANEITYTVSDKFVEFRQDGGNLYPEHGGYNIIPTVDAYIYKNNKIGAPLPTLGLGNACAILLGNSARLGIAINSSDNIINPINPTYYNNNFVVYESAFHSYNSWVSNMVFEILDYLPKEVFLSGAKYVSLGEVGLNITVTMTVTATGQKIVSSRTYPIEYETMLVK